MSVTLHTDLGDIKIELECDRVKKASYNFLALCASGYYDNTLIHRNVKGFMVQMGDPTGTGKGGITTRINRVYGVSNTSKGRAYGIASLKMKLSLVYDILIEYFNSV
jgi:cyclophilin family peptidyl-prolyl cis-trans isomerase